MEGRGRPFLSRCSFSVNITAPVNECYPIRPAHATMECYPARFDFQSAWWNRRPDAKSHSKPRMEQTSLAALAPENPRSRINLNRRRLLKLILMRPFKSQSTPEWSRIITTSRTRLPSRSSNPIYTLPPFIALRYWDINDALGNRRNDLWTGILKAKDSPQSNSSDASVQSCIINSLDDTYQDRPRLSKIISHRVN